MAAASAAMVSLCCHCCSRQHEAAAAAASIYTHPGNQLATARAEEDIGSIEDHLSSCNLQLLLGYFDVLLDSLDLRDVAPWHHHEGPQGTSTRCAVLTNHHLLHFQQDKVLCVVDAPQITYDLPSIGDGDAKPRVHEFL
eukprot:CAMPEP_0206601998 /NCGR_PEP_ID=MMETSP0325_2-20121206/47037_1 /ASSEMBLY_ACC=CAM_ASM_000347 /TAXON_ID=2866 /ORGANISM="Crypthecodinium cohnii, Strain Seligo" /LENGTH=138 /DNA_ID=CAMNT_0054114225 /DNA_START=104 /DNA_END=520 /DNA_ORIENTATION=+